MAQKPENCAGKGNTIELDECYGREYKRADAALNQLYQELMKKLSDASERALLRSAEEAWVSFRDKECEFETAGTSDGTIHPIEVSVCLTDKTNARIKELQAQLNCPEGDLTCVHAR
jgi:uncharacterized protein YecT (DUF1311 family)